MGVPPDSGSLRITTEEAGLKLVQTRDFSGRGRAAYEALLVGGATWVSSTTAALRRAQAEGAR